MPRMPRIAIVVILVFALVSGSTMIASAASGGATLSSVKVRCNTAKGVVTISGTIYRNMVAVGSNVGVSIYTDKGADGKEFVLNSANKQKFSITLWIEPGEAFGTYTISVGTKILVPAGYVHCQDPNA